MLESRDTALMQAGLTALGAGFEGLADGRLRVVPAATVSGGAQIDCGLAGTVMRFLPPIAALSDQATSFRGDPAAAARPVADLLAALAELGARISQPPQLPFDIAGSPHFTGGSVRIDAAASSQFVSALLLAGARYIDGIEIEVTGALPSAPHVAMTCTLLERRGVEVTRPGATKWRVAPGPIAALDEVVEPDLTNAATLLAAALVAGGELTTAWPIDSVQAADELLEVLRAFGAETDFTMTEQTREVTLRGSGGIRGAAVDLHQVSELTPVAAALAVLADGPSRLSGVAHIRGHETDRLAALAAGLGGLGAAVTQTPDGLEIQPSGRHGGVFPTHADHRLAHAGALVGLATPGVVLDDVTCTSKTMPDFPDLWAGLLGGPR